MPANTNPNERTYRLTTGETVTYDELIRRVTERVYTLWMKDVRLARERGTESTARIGRGTNRRTR